MVVLNPIQLPTKVRIPVTSLVWWQQFEVESVLKGGEHLYRYDQENVPSYFTIEGPRGSRSFHFSIWYIDPCAF